VAVVAVDRCADDLALPYPGDLAELDAVVAQAGPDAFAAEADTWDGDALAAVIAEAGQRWGGRTRRGRRRFTASLPGRSRPPPSRRCWTSTWAAC
jgi:hypothetical protein